MVRFENECPPQVDKPPLEQRYKRRSFDERLRSLAPEHSGSRHDEDGSCGPSNCKSASRSVSLLRST